MAFKSYSAPGQFRPRKAQSQEDNIKQQAASIKEGMRAVQEQTDRNMSGIREVTKIGQTAVKQNRKEIFDAETQNKQEIRDQYQTNFEITQQNIARENKKELDTLNSIKEFSETAFQYGQQFVKEREKGLQTAFSQAVYQSGITAAEAVEVITTDNLQAASVLDRNTTIQRLLDNGASMEMLEYIKKVGGGNDRYLKSEALLQNTVANSTAILEELKTKEYTFTDQLGDSVTMTYNEAFEKGDVTAATSIQRRMNNEWIEISQVGKYDPQVVGTKVFPQIRQYWASENRSLKAQGRVKTQERIETEKAVVFGSNMAKPGGVATNWSIVQSSTNKSENSKSFLENLTNYVAANPDKAGSIKQQLQGLTVDINGDGNRKPAFGPSGVLSSSKEYATLARQIETSEGVVITRQQRVFTEQNLQKKKWLQEAYAKLEERARNGELTDADVEVAREEAEAAFPGLIDSNEFSQFETVEEAQVEAETKRAMALAEANLLTEEELATFSIKVRSDKTLSSIAKATSTAQNSSNDFSTIDKEITKKVRLAVKAGPDGNNNPTIDPEIASLKREARAFASRYLADNPNASWTQVEKAIRDTVFAQWDTEAANLQGGKIDRTNDQLLRYSAWIPDAKDAERAGVQSQVIRARLQNPINPKTGEKNETKITTYPVEGVATSRMEPGLGPSVALAQPNFLFSEKEAAKLAGEYGKPGFKLPWSVKYASDIIPNMGPNEVFLAQMKANGQEIKPTPSMEAASDLAPFFQRLTQKYPTPDRSTRALGSAGSFDPRVIKDGYGYMVQSSAQTYGINPSYTAALFEIESKWDPGARSDTKAIGIAQIQQDMHPGYTGGADPAANIDYGTQYYAQLLNQFNNDPVIAAGAYNAGPNRMLEHIENGRPLPAETVKHMKAFSKALYKYGDKSQLRNPGTMRRSFTGALTYRDNKQSYVSAGKEFENLGFRVGEHSDFGGTAPVHANDSYHNYDEAFDITHWKGTRLDSIEKTRQLKEAIRSLGLFEEIIGPGDGDPNHESHLHVGGLMRPMTEQDRQTLRQLFK